VRTRIIKILNGTCKAALSSMSSPQSGGGSNSNSSSSSSQVHPRVKDLVTTSPLSTAVIACCDADSVSSTAAVLSIGIGTGSRINREEVTNLVSFAMQLRDLSKKL